MTQHGRSARATEQQPAVEHLRAVLDHAPSGLMLVLGPTGAPPVLVNRRLCEMLGYSEAELLARPAIELVHPDDRAAAEERGALVRRGETVELRRARLVRKDGGVVHAEAYAAPFSFDGQAPALLLELRDVSPLAESRAVATMVAGVAHDFNNLLTAIAGSLDLVRRDPENRDRWLDNAQLAAERAGDLVGQILQFSRRDVPVRRPVGLPALLAETVEIARESFDQRVALEVVDPAAGLPEVLADEGQVQQVLLNLLLNARDAVEERMRASDARFTPRVTLHFGRAWLPPTDAKRHPRPAASVTVEDNGPGMPEEVRERVFDPFFSTKEAGQGTGLGLATAFAIVADHAGQIEVRSRPGQGAAFTLVLPVAPALSSDGPREDETPEATPAAMPPGRRILVVDDEPLIREIAEQTLLRAGFEVVVAGGGHEAIRAAGEAPLDAAVLDVNMPAPNGWDVLESLHREDAGLKVLMASGYASEDDAFERGASAFLPKPYTPQRLLDAVARLFED